MIGGYILYRSSFFIGSIFSILFILGCNSEQSSYRKATVVKMSAIWAPANLANDSECRALYSNITRYGIDMDESRNDWNQVILASIYKLIERGCVIEKIPE